MKFKNLGENITLEEAIRVFSANKNKAKVKVCKMVRRSPDLMVIVYPDTKKMSEVETAEYIFKDFKDTSLSIKSFLNLVYSNAVDDIRHGTMKFTFKLAHQVRTVKDILILAAEKEEVEIFKSVSTVVENLDIVFEAYKLSHNKTHYNNATITILAEWVVAVVEEEEK